MQANENSTHQTKDPVLLFFNRVIAQVSRVLAAIMVMVIIWGVADVVYVLHQRLIAPPFMLLEIKDILATFGAFMAVLIAIEIFHNIILYVEDNHNRQLAVEIVLGTALMAIARKVIVLDFNKIANFEWSNEGDVKVAEYAHQQFLADDQYRASHCRKRERKTGDCRCPYGNDDEQDQKPDDVSGPDQMYPPFFR